MVAWHCHATTEFIEYLLRGFKDEFYFEGNGFVDFSFFPYSKIKSVEIVLCGEVCRGDGGRNGDRLGDVANGEVSADFICILAVFVDCNLVRNKCGNGECVGLKKVFVEQVFGKSIGVGGHAVDLDFDLHAGIFEV